MFQKRILLALAFAGLTGVAACGGDASEEAVVEEPTAETTTDGELQVAPEVYEGATVMDTSNIAPAPDADTATTGQ